MGILKHKPFFLWIVTGFLAFVGLLIGLEVYRMPLIFWTLQNVGYGIARPVIGIVRRRVSRCPACLLKMDCRRYDFILFQNTGNLRRSVTVQTKGKYPLDYFGGFSVHNPPFSVIRVFPVPIGRVGAKVLARFSFGLHHSADFLACIFCVPFVDDVQKKGGG